MTNDIEIFKPRVTLEDLENKLLKLDQVDCPVIHRFGPGIYIREVRIPAGTFVIGHCHKYEHTSILLKGKMTINNAGIISDLIAPAIVISKPGQKCAYIHEDIMWLNIYSTNETDVEILEKTLLDKSPAWEEANKLKENERKKQIADINDYHKFLSEFGFTEKETRIITEDESDQIPMPLGGYKIQVSNSSIEGKGVFATAKIESNEIIGPARIGSKRTPIGRYVNHSVNPNAKMFDSNGDIYLMSLTEINGCSGGFLGEEITTDYRKNLKLIGGIKNVSRSCSRSRSRSSSRSRSVVYIK